MREFLFGYRRPPLILVQPRLPFRCQQCGEPGIGPANSKVHAGECQRLWNIAASKRTRYRQQERRRLAQAATA